MKNHLISRHPNQCPRVNRQESTTMDPLTLDNFVTPKKCSAVRSKEITRKIAEMVARDLRPISIVNVQGFKNFVNYIEPGYSVPSHTHIATVCHRLYESEKENLATMISKSEHFGLTTDIWTSSATQAYMTVTVHFIDESWKLCSKVLVTEEMPERHTGQHISDRLIKVASAWKIPPDKITACVRDNAANAVNGLQLTGWCHFGCAAHTLQLCINSGLNNVQIISQMIATCRKIVGHFKHSVVAMTGLREKQQQLEVPLHNLIQDVSTRWNSTYFMLERLVEQRVAIYAVIHDPAITKPEHRHLDLKDAQWEVLSQMVIVLKPLQMATTVFSSDLNVSCSIIYPVINGLLSNHLIVGQDDVPPVKRFKEIVAGELQRRFTPSSERLPILCAAVDPSYSNLCFLDEEQRDNVRDELEHQIDSHDNSVPSASLEEIPPAKRSKTSSAMSFLLGTLSDETQAITSGYDEIKYFIREPPLHPDSSALEWWRRNHDRFPRLAELARKFMCVPATSVPSERVFSTSGSIVNKQRCSLKPENVDMLVFLNKNLPSPTLV